jgi:midasin
MLREQLDERLQQRAAAGPGPGSEADAAYGRAVWARCAALTAAQAAELTEALRLVLQPTLASRLAGDYSSGKRINMKKVQLGGYGTGAGTSCLCIGIVTLQRTGTFALLTDDLPTLDGGPMQVIAYIASQFRRDKIWMRRTRPEKRHYQVPTTVDVLLHA